MRKINITRNLFISQLWAVLGCFGQNIGYLCRSFVGFFIIMEKIIFNQETKETCMFNHNIIGSPQCLKCDYLVGFDLEENWIKCKLYHIAKEHKLIDQNKTYFENQAIVLNFMLKHNKTTFNNGGL